MGVQVEIDPIPRFDRSLISWLGKFASSVRQGFSKVPGSEWKTGVYNASFVAVAGINVYVPFDYTFKKGIPLVTASVSADQPGAHQYYVDVTGANTTQWIIHVRTLDGGAVTATVPVRWLAIIP